MDSKGKELILSSKVAPNTDSESNHTHICYIKKRLSTLNTKMVYEVRFVNNLLT